MILLLAHTGLRWGEASGLRVKRLDLLRRRITVAETLVEFGGHLHTSTPKNQQERQVPIPGWLAEELAGGSPNRPQTTLSSPPATASRSAISISGETSST